MARVPANGSPENAASSLAPSTFAKLPAFLSQRMALRIGADAMDLVAGRGGGRVILL
jgi:hypothetical protein